MSQGVDAYWLDETDGEGTGGGGDGDYGYNTSYGPAAVGEGEGVSGVRGARVRARGGWVRVGVRG